MFSDELQMLIDAAIADGEITDKERAILQKRAEKEGLDIDEFNMLVDACLAKKKSEAKSQERKAPVYTKAKSLSSTIDTIAYNYKSKIRERKETGPLVIGNTSREEIDVFNIERDMDIFRLEQARNKEIETAIKNLYIPNDEVEIWHLLMMLKPMAAPDYKSPYGKEVNEAYKIKYEECLSMAKANFPDDPKISKFIKEIEDKENQEKQQKMEQEALESRQTAVRLKKEIKEEEKRLQQKYLRKDYNILQKKITKATINIIEAFLLPVEKNDLLGLMELFYPYSNKKSWKKKDKWPRKLGESYYKKYREACKIVKENYPSDPDFDKYIPKPKGFFAKLFGK